VHLEQSGGSGSVCDRPYEKVVPHPLKTVDRIRVPGFKHVLYSLSRGFFFSSYFADEGLFFTSQFALENVAYFFNFIVARLTWIITQNHRNLVCRRVIFLGFV